MKKKYISPITEVVKIENEGALCKGTVLKWEGGDNTSTEATIDDGNDTPSSGTGGFIWVDAKPQTQNDFNDSWE